MSCKIQLAHNRGLYIPYSLLLRRMCLYHHRKKVVKYELIFQSLVKAVVITFKVSLRTYVYWNANFQDLDMCLYVAQDVIMYKPSELK